MARAAEETLNLSPGAAVAPRRSARRRPHPLLPPLPAPSVGPSAPAASPPNQRKAGQPSSLILTQTDSGVEAKPKRRRGSRGGRRHKKAWQPVAAVEEPLEPEGEAEA